VTRAEGPWQTVWKRHRRFSADGTWDKILAELVADAAGGPAAPANFP
jgi:transposase